MTKGKVQGNVTTPPKANKLNKTKNNTSGVSNVNTVKNDILSQNVSDAEISIDLPKTVMSQESKMLLEQISLMKAEYEGRFDFLQKEIALKNDIIGKLQSEIGELKQSYSFLSNETALISGRLKSNETILDSHAKKHNEINEKASDLEDRSRRNNLVFFNFPEERPNESINENCEKKVIDLLEKKRFFDEDYNVYIDRAHRLGKPDNQNSKPRPIIVRLTYFKDKETIIRNGKKLQGCPISVSEDFSKPTLAIHRQLRQHAKEAKEYKFTDPTKAILNYRTTYKRVLLTYTTDKSKTTSKTFTKSFSLQDILQNPTWYVPSY